MKSKRQQHLLSAPQPQERDRWLDRGLSANSSQAIFLRSRDSGHRRAISLRWSKRLRCLLALLSIFWIAPAAAQLGPSDFVTDPADILTTGTSDNQGNRAPTGLPGNRFKILEGGKKILTIRLKTAPANDVVVKDISGSFAGRISGYFSNDTFTFTSANWNTPQSIGHVNNNNELSASEDPNDTSEEGYLELKVVQQGQADQFIYAHIIIVDNDNGALDVDNKTLSVDESGSTKFNVKLTQAPDATVTVALTLSGDSDVSLDKTSLTFTSATGPGGWDTNQEVTVSARNDSDATNDSASIYLEATEAGGGGYTYLNETVSVTVNDDDRGAMVITPSTKTLSIAEGSSANFMVRLMHQPSSSVTVTLTAPTNPDVTIDKTSLSFSTGNWNVDQAVVVTVAQDADGVNENATIAISNSLNGSDTVTVTGTDDDSRGLTLSNISAIEEGETGTFTVRLATQPTATVTVNLTQPSNADVKVDTDTGTNGNQTALTFNTTSGTGGWDTNQTVTVITMEDADREDESATIDLSATGGDYAGETASLTVNVTDDDTGELTLPANAVAVTEGETATFPVRLSAAPPSNVTVTLTQPSNTEVTLDTDTSTNGNQNTLTFTTANWQTNQMVTVSAADDDDASDENRTSISLSATGGGYDSATGTVHVDVTDDDEEALVFPLLPVEVHEGASGSFGVRLETQPPTTVTVMLAQPSNTDVTIDKTSLTFTSSTGTGGWDTNQTVTVNSAEDNDVGNDSTTISLTASGGGYDDETGTVSITVNNNDQASFTFTPDDVTVAEGSSTTTFNVKLASQPTGDVTVMLAQPGNTDVTVDTDTDMTGNQMTLTFTSDNYNTDQAVTVSASQDDDITNDSASISVTASGGGFGSATGTVSVTVTDDDEASLVLPSDVNVTEGADRTFDVKLGAQPSGDVTVTLAQPSNTDVTVDTDTSTGNNQNTLTFTSGNWNTNQQVRVSAAEDDDAANDTGVSISVTASGGGFDSANGTVMVSVTDNDEEALTLSDDDLTIAEGGNVTFTVKLDTQPPSDVTVTFGEPSNTDVTVDTDAGTANDQDTLTFTSAKNTTGGWNMPQTVTVSAAHDDDAWNDTGVSISITASGGGYGDVTDTVAVQVTDDDEEDLTLLPATTVSLEEGGAGTFSVKLATLPSATVTVTFTQPLDPDVRVDTDTSMPNNQTTLEFTANNWNMAKTVIVNAAQDADATDESTSVSMSAAGGGYDNVSEKTLNIAVSDDEEAQLVFSSDDLDVDEGGFVDFTVKLAASPSADVTVTLTQPSNDDVTLDKTSLTFTSTTWNNAQTVRVNAAEDHDTADESTSISLSATGGDYAGAAGLVRVDVSDDDEEALERLPAGRLSVDEGGNVAFTVRLETLPSANVTVTLTPPSNTDVTIDKTSLTFTNTDWDTPQTVTATAGEDPDASNERASISISAAHGGYDNLGGSVDVDVKDNDEEALVFTPESLSITEGESGEFKVRLATLPSATVTVRLTQPSNGDVTLDTDSTTDGNQNTLDFGSGNWNTDRTVSVSAAEDDDLTADSATIAVSASGGGYDSVNKSMSVAVADNDSAGLTVSPTDLDIDEGQHGNFTVRLTQQPSATVTVRLTQPSNADVRVDKTSLSFTNTDWNTEQTVRVNVAQDGDASDESTSVSLSASGGGYNVSESVSVDVTDDDEDALVLPPDDLRIDEGESGAFTVRLATQPSATVTVTLTQPSNADVTVDTDPDTAGNQNTLSFTTTTWRDARTVAVAVSEDSDAANESATIAVEASNGGYDSLRGTVNVEVSDDDRQALVAPESLSITEGDGGTFDVKLATLPSASVRVILDLPSNPVVTIDKDSLTFTQDNWNDGQTVAVSTNEDEDTAQDIATITLRASNLVSASDSGYDGVSDTVRIEVTDNDTPGLTVSPGNLEIIEGRSTAFTVRLTRPPSDDVTVTLTPPSNTDISIDKTLLTFTVDNWNSGQAVMVSAAEDDDSDDEEARIVYRASGADYGGIQGTVAVELIDKDDIVITLPGTRSAIIVNPGILALDEEGSSQTFAVRLDAVNPTSDFSVVLTTNNPDITLSPGSLTFRPSNWNQDQTVTVNAGHDPDSVDDTGTITLAAVGIEVPPAQVRVDVTDNDEPLPPPPAGALGSIVVVPDILVLGEGSSRDFMVRLEGSEPEEDVTLALGKTNDDITISPQSLTFTSSNHDQGQTVTVSAVRDADTQDDSDIITLAASDGGYEGVMQRLPLTVIDTPGTIGISPEPVEIQEGGPAVSFTVRLGVEPIGSQVVIVSLTSSNPGIEFSPSSLVFMENDWNRGRSVSVRAAAGSNRQGGLDIITATAGGGNYSSTRKTVSVVYVDDGSQGEGPSLSDPIKAQALAIPPAVAGDESTLSISCRQESPCPVMLDCAAQNDGSTYQGALPEPIPARGVRRLTAADIESYTGGSWSGKGRLGCALRSKGNVASQVWTRSGDGVLVNNSAYIRSYPEGDGYRADIESITSPDGFEKSNIRIRCTASGGQHCTSTRFECYQDDGVRHDSPSFGIAGLSVRHLQSEELASMISHRWRGMELACELRSDASFTVQVLTRTGGGGALVNNSGGGSARIGLSGG